VAEHSDGRRPVGSLAWLGRGTPLLERRCSIGVHPLPAIREIPGTTRAKTSAVRDLRREAGDHGVHTNHEGDPRCRGCVPPRSGSPSAGARRGVRLPRRLGIGDRACSLIVAASCIGVSCRFPPDDSSHWICRDCGTAWRWNEFGEWCEEEISRQTSSSNRAGTSDPPRSRRGPADAVRGCAAPRRWLGQL